jgi:hypothetical protein
MDRIIQVTHSKFLLNGTRGLLKKINLLPFALALDHMSITLNSKPSADQVIMDNFTDRLPIKQSIPISSALASTWRS